MEPVLEILDEDYNALRGGKGQEVSLELILKHKAFPGRDKQPLSVEKHCEICQ